MPAKTPKTPKPKAKAGSHRINGLLPKQAKFCTEYLLHGNASKAALAAGYSPKTAHVIGQENLRKPAIASFLAQKNTVIAQRQDARLDAMELTRERIERETARLAFLDPRKLFDADGMPIPIHLLDADTAAAIQGIEVKEHWVGTQDKRRLSHRSYKYKIGGKNESLERAAKFRGMFAEDNNQRTDPLAQLLAGLQARAVPVVVDDPRHRRK